MNRDELLPNKYERLCAEYNKLRTKYRDVKDTLNTYITENKKSVALLNEKDALIKKLEEECKALRLQFDHKYGGSGVSNTVTSDSPRVNLFSSLINVQTVSSANGTNSLNHTVHQSEYIASTACQSLCDQSENLQDLDQLISSFIKALSDWTDATQSTQKPLESKEVKNELIEQIARLETQVFDISLKYQMERRRHRMLENEHSSTMPNELPENDNDFRVLNPVNGANGNYSLMLDWMHDRIYSATEQAQYFAVRAAFLQDEVSSLLSVFPHFSLPCFCHIC
ncbi:hypothetical protein FGIG_11502 [Fasciola gigantica]|uniref:Uncharacterized protein n=1 Tax=Fasciola gigantica TaxID=46835 RepID=A0A504YY55_FASGI|nr:hypothetical protein FGIG_11502 [Fasciola gigantica]